VFYKFFALSMNSLDSFFYAANFNS
jgi:hypothetical protein